VSDYPCYRVKAGVDLSASQFLAVTISAATGLLQVATSVGAVLGILQDTPTLGEFGEYMLFGGVSYVVSGAAIAYRDRLACNASGAMVTASAGAGTNYNAVALTTASGAGQLVLAQLIMSKV